MDKGQPPCPFTGDSGTTPSLMGAKKTFLAPLAPQMWCEKWGSGPGCPGLKSPYCYSMLCVLDKLPNFSGLFPDMNQGCEDGVGQDLRPSGQLSSGSTSCQHPGFHCPNHHSVFLVWEHLNPHVTPPPPTLPQPTSSRWGERQESQDPDWVREVRI